MAAQNQSGFTTVELLSTLIIAALFIAIFYQLYLVIDATVTKANYLAVANEITYAKVQQYENMSFNAIATPGGTSSAEVEDYSASLPTTLPGTETGKVSTALQTPTLKAVNVKTSYGTQVIEYTVYIQESGVGR